jgi:glyoxylase-like metal-dependent hydrolase (beta-lactamase superfamily II)
VIKVKTFIFNPLQVNTYVVSDDSGQGIIIDPGCEEEDEFKILIHYIKSQNIVPSSIVITHGHADHVVGLKSVTDEFKIVPKIHRDESQLLSSLLDQATMFGLNYFPYEGEWSFVEENEIIPIGEASFKILLVPGHSPASIALYCSTDNCVFTGDALFKRSIGRTDFIGGNHEILINNIKNKLLTLPGSTIVFPGHGPSSTIEDEARYNPFLV